MSKIVEDIAAKEMKEERIEFATISSTMAVCPYLTFIIVDFIGWE